MRFFRLLGLALAYLGACSAYAAYDPLGPGVGTALQLPAAGSGAIALVISPTNYGAKCDGSTDDSTALTSWAAAITAGDYIAFAVSAGTCATLDAAATAQVHQN